MTKIILSINAGSSSVKISIFSASQGDSSPTLLASSQISGLTSPPPTFKYSRSDTSTIHDQALSNQISDQNAAFQYILTHLINDESFPQISQLSDIALASHRVVHGGDYKTSQLITRETYHHLETLTDLAPLHNASALAIIQHCITHLPSTRNIAVFDSQFHASIPEHISTYPIDQEIAKKNGLRKYGFHGISYAFITRSVAEFLGKKEEETNIIALHLGSGASACVVKNGKSWDTSMGLTPLAGLPGATRSGSLDPRYVFLYLYPSIYYSSIYSPLKPLFSSSQQPKPTPTPIPSPLSSLANPLPQLQSRLPLRHQRRKTLSQLHLLPTHLAR